jgi:hypothetical protein
MPRITTRELRQLTGRRDQPCISIYMPTHLSGTDVRQDPIRFKNLVNEALTQLTRQGMAEGEAKLRLQPLYRLQEDMTFWRNQDRSLAVLLSEAQEEPILYQTHLEVKEEVFVGDRFLIKPLLPLLSQGMPFYILALSKNDVRLLRADRDSVTRLELPDEVPTSFSEAMAVDVEERHLEFHSGTSGHQAGRDRPAAFHGQGQGSDDAREKRKLREYCLRINAPVAKMLANQRDPMILAATEPLEGIYREVNSYEALAEVFLSGNYDRADDRRLQQEGWELLEPRIRRRIDENRDKFKHLIGEDRASTDLGAIVHAAENGQVETLFVSTEDHRWGQYDSQSGRSEVHQKHQPGDEDLLDRAAAEVLLHGGEVLALGREKIPSRAALAATYRFAT